MSSYLDGYNQPNDSPKISGEFEYTDTDWEFPAGAVTQAHVLLYAPLTIKYKIEDGEIVDMQIFETNVTDGEHIDSWLYTAVMDWAKSDKKWLIEHAENQSIFNMNHSLNQSKETNCPVELIAAILAGSNIDLQCIEQVTALLVEHGFRPSQVCDQWDDIIIKAENIRSTIIPVCARGGNLTPLFMVGAVVACCLYSPDVLAFQVTKIVPESVGDRVVGIGAVIILGVAFLALFGAITLRYIISKFDRIENE